MYRKIILALAITTAQAHEMTPAYPKLTDSYVSGVKKLTVSMFNRREDVEYFEIGVFTKDWRPVHFVTQYKILKLPYQRHVMFDVYIRNEDAADSEYVCSQSKVRSDSEKATPVSSRICSKLQH